MLFGGDQASVTLRPYQEDMADRAIENILVKKHRGTLVVAPMGCGKSLTMAATAIRICNETGKGVLILAHYRGLVKGNRKAVRQLGGKCYIYCGEEKDVIWSDVKNNGAIVSASIQALGNRQLEKIDPGMFAVILMDEGHHAILDSQYDVIRRHFNAPVILYTATPDRADGVALASDKAMCESIAYNGHVRDFVRDGWILEPRIRYETTINMDWSVIGRGNGEVTEQEANEVWENNKAAWAVIKPLLKSSVGMPTIGFAPSVKLAKLWARLVNDDRPDTAEYVASYRPGNYTDARLEFYGGERRLIEERFEAGILQYLFNQGVYLEGADLVKARLCMLGAITTSRPRCVQMIGRVLRPANNPETGLSILIGHEKASASKRLELIAGSEKPWAEVVDYAGASGPNKLSHPVDLYGYGTDMRPEVRERVKEAIEERVSRGEESVPLEEIVAEQEESYNKFLVRDARVRQSIMVDCETVTRDIDPWGAPDVTSGQRYVIRKINPAAQSTVDQIAKCVKELGRRPYSDDFYRGLTNAKAHGVLHGLKKQVKKMRESLPCPKWVTDKLESMGSYAKPNNKAEGIALLVRMERTKEAS